jgi:uncharacterized membrane protein
VIAGGLFDLMRPEGILAMPKGRLEAFSDGVLAIIITIMVLEMKVPHDAHDLAALRPVLPVFLSYLLSFIYVGIYWNNHHHLFHVAQRVTGGILWSNLHLLFWLSLIPFVTGWMGENHFAPTPVALYGFVLLMAGVAFVILTQCLLRQPGGNPVLAGALGRDVKGKVSMLAYACAIPLSFVNRWIACATYATVAMIWLIPDRRIERKISVVPPGAY